MPTREPTILVVDDDAQIRTFVARQLKNEGYNVELARTGDEALERAAELIPDLIVLDVNMPIMDGVEALRRLREWGSMPVIVLSARTEEQLKAAGVAYKIGKYPFTADPRSRANGATEGFVKVLADKATDRVLGVHIIGAEAGTMIGEAAVAMEFQASAEDIGRIEDIWLVQRALAHAPKSL